MKRIHPNVDVLVLDERGVNLGRMSYRDAESLAANQNLDLVQMNKDEESPVFKIMDHGKWKYFKKKGQKKSPTRQLKEMNFKVCIDSHDQETKINHIKRFLSKGADVKIGVQMRGREKANPSFARKKLDSIIAEIQDLVQIQQMKTTNSSIFATVRPLQRKPDDAHSSS